MGQMSGKLADEPPQRPVWSATLEAKPVRKWEITVNLLRFPKEGEKSFRSGVKALKVQSFATLG